MTVEEIRGYLKEVRHPARQDADRAYQNRTVRPSGFNYEDIDAYDLDHAGSDFRKYMDQ